MEADSLFAEELLIDLKLETTFTVKEHYQSSHEMISRLWSSSSNGDDYLLLFIIESPMNVVKDCTVEIRFRIRCRNTASIHTGDATVFYRETSVPVPDTGCIWPVTYIRVGRPGLSSSFHRDFGQTSMIYPLCICLSDLVWSSSSSSHMQLLQQNETACSAVISDHLYILFYAHWVPRSGTIASMCERTRIEGLPRNRRVE